MKTIRKDNHRPSIMNPTDYVVLAICDTFKEFNPETGNDYTEVEYESCDPRWEEMGEPTDSTWAGHSKNRCDHCGTRVKYTCVVLHKPTGDIIEVGRTCASRFLSDTWSLPLQIAQTRRRKANNVTKWVADNPAGADLPAFIAEHSSNAFLRKMLERIEEAYGLSENQIAAIRKVQAAHINPPTIPQGIATITGTIKRIKVETQNFGYSRWSAQTTRKVTIECEGYKAWGTLPESVSNAKEGDRITLTADFQPAKDPLFVTFKRPRNASVTVTDSSGAGVAA